MAPQKFKLFSNTFHELNYGLMRIFLLATIFMAGIPIHVKAAQTVESSSITTQNRSPFVMLFALARPEYRSQLEEGQIRYTARAEVSNYLSVHRGREEYLFIDGETQILTQEIGFHWIGYEWQLSLPWIKHSRGKLDRFIYDFHDVLQLPQNGRTDNFHEELNWQLNGGGERLARIDAPTQSLGDTSVTVYKTLDNNWQANAMLKIPTGKFSKQSGSQNPDLGIAISQHNPSWFSERNWLSETPLAVWWGMGLNYLGKVGQLDALDQKHVVATFRTGMAWEITSQWQFKCQLDSNSQLFDSDIRELGWIPVQATLGGQYQLERNGLIGFNIVEDLRPRVTPDVVFSIDYTTVF